MSPFNNLTDQRFGRLVAISPTEKRDKGRCIIWLLRCDCGNLTEVSSNNLLMKRTKSCGCLQDEQRANKPALKHGDTSNGETSRLYRIWRGMKQRCFNLNDHRYRWYGKKGVIVCNEWRGGYLNFKNWALANGYADNLTIDRIDNDGNYEPLNCQWITQSENSRRDY